MTATLSPEDRRRGLMCTYVRGEANDFYFWNMWERETDKMSSVGTTWDNEAQSDSAKLISTSAGVSSEFVTQHIIKITKFNKLALLYINSSNYKYPNIWHKIAVLLLYCNNVPCVHRKSHPGFFLSLHFQLDKKRYIFMTELFAGISDVCFNFTAVDMTEMTVPARLTGEAVAVNND